MEELLGKDVRQRTHEAHQLAGFFDHYSGLTGIADQRAMKVCEVPFDLEDRDLPKGDLLAEIKEWRRKLKGLPDDIQLDSLVTWTVRFHEWRHLLDCFCTPVGLNGLLNIAKIAAAKANVISCAKLSGSDTREEGFNNDQESVRLLNLADELEEFLYYEFGHEPLCVIEGSLEEKYDFVICEIPTQRGNKLEIPCAHFRVSMDGGLVTIIWPLGFTTITEFLAILMQGQLIGEVNWNLRLQFRERLKQMTFKSPYLVLLANLVAIFKKRGQNPDDDVLYRCVFWSLFYAIDYKNKNTICGSNLIAILTHWVDVGEKGIAWHGPSSNEIFRRKFLVPLADKWPFQFVDYVKRSYFDKFSHNEELIAISNGPLFIDDMSAVWLWGHLPYPPIIVFHGKRFICQDLEFKYLWSWWTLYLSVIDHISKNLVPIVCPFRDEQNRWKYPDKKAMPHKFCMKHIRDKTCGLWHARTRYEGPHCAWKQTVDAVLGLD